MAERLSIRHERIDDVPLMIGVANPLRLAEIQTQSQFETWVNAVSLYTAFTQNSS